MLLNFPYCPGPNDVTLPGRNQSVRCQLTCGWGGKCCKHCFVLPVASNINCDNLFELLSSQRYAHLLPLISFLITAVALLALETAGEMALAQDTRYVLCSIAAVALRSVHSG